MLHLLTERNKPRFVARRTRTPNTTEGHGAQCHDLALKILEDYVSENSAYAALLDIAVNTYLVVVALDNDRDEHLLSFESPVALRNEGVAGRVWRRLRASRRGYQVSYITRLPPTIRSYHFILEAQEGLEVETMFLSTNADKQLANLVSADLRDLAEVIRQDRPNDSSRKIVELEAQVALRRLNEIVRRRRWEAGQAVAEAELTGTAACDSLCHAVVAGEGVHGGSEGVDNSILSHPAVSPRALEAASREIEDSEAYRDLSLEADESPAPRAHAYWRRAISRHLGGEHIEVRASALIVDTTSSGPRSVRVYALAVSAIAYIVGCFMTNSLLPYFGRPAESLGMAGNPDALVTVLLLIPGFLYSRLALPDRRSVRGYLQALPRLIAHGCIFLMAIFAASIAAGADFEVVRWMLLGVTLVPIAAVLLLLPPRRATSDRVLLMELGAPIWLMDPTRRGLRRSSPDVEFRSTEELSR
jgi:hypothetical protein